MFQDLMVGSKKLKCISAEPVDVCGTRDLLVQMMD